MGRKESNQTNKINLFQYANNYENVMMETLSGTLNTMLQVMYECHKESSKHDIITPQCIDKMLSNNTFLETRI